MKQPERSHPLAGLLPPGTSLEQSPQRLADLPARPGVIVIPSKAFEGVLQYDKEFAASNSATAGTTDILGFGAIIRNANSPAHSVNFVTRALSKCFGMLRSAPDLPSALQTSGGVIAVVDILLRVPNPLQTSYRVIQDVIFIDRKLQQLGRVEVENWHLSRPFMYREGFVAQQEAAEEFQNKLRQVRGGSCEI